jgi:hypothetical protein
MLREYPSGFWVTGNLSDPPPSAIPHAGGMNYNAPGKLDSGISYRAVSEHGG